jgi:uncharacterized protein (DUF4415 family)
MKGKAMSESVRYAIDPDKPPLKPTKITVTVRLDSDVLAWLKKDGKGYQDRMNAILREAMLRSL